MEKKKQIKVGLISPYFFPHKGGVPVHVYNQYLGLKNMGFEVKIISPDFGKSQDIVCSDLIKLGKPIPIIYNGSLTYISFAFKAKEILRTEKFDIIHVHEPYHPFSLWFIKNFKRNVGTFHVFREEPEKLLLKLGKPFIKIMRENLSIAVAVSKTASKIVMSYFGVPEEKIRIIPNGIDFQRFDEAEPLRNLAGKFNILFVGRLEPRKGVKHLIRAYRTVKKIIPDSRLIIVGSGMRAYYLSFITEDIEKNVIFMGEIPSENLQRVYKSADICVFPSNRGESFGIVLLEAMAAGKPVIAGNAEGYRELLQDGKYGIIVDPRDEDALARSIVELYFKDEKRKELAEKGRKYAMNFDWKNVIKDISRLYVQILGE